MSDDNKKQKVAAHANTPKISTEELSARIKDRLNHTQRKGSLNQARIKSSMSAISVVNTPEHLNKKGERVPEIYHAEFKSLLGGGILTIRTEKDYQKLLYLDQHPEARKALLEIGSAVFRLNALDVPEQTGDDLVDDGSYGF